MAGVSPDETVRILAQLAHRLDRADALARRDYWLCRAHDLVGHIRILSAALHRYETTAWPCLRHLAEPPPNDTPLRTAMFRICQAADDAGTGIPKPRRLRDIVQST
jgi:hypothetical protein